MKIIASICCMMGIAMAQVEYAVVVQQEEFGVWKRSESDQRDYAPILEDYDLRVDGEETDEGAFGMPTHVIVRSHENCYLLILNNVHGVIHISEVKEKEDHWIDSGKNAVDRWVYFPELYQKLKDAGLRVLTLDEVRSQIKSKRKKKLAKPMN